MPHKKPGPTKILQRDNGAFDDSQHMVTFTRPGDGTWNLAHHHILSNIYDLYNSPHL